MFTKLIFNYTHELIRAFHPAGMSINTADKFSLEVTVLEAERNWLPLITKELEFPDKTD